MSLGGGTGERTGGFGGVDKDHVHAKVRVDFSVASVDGEPRFSEGGREKGLGVVERLEIVGTAVIDEPVALPCTQEELPTRSKCVEPRRAHRGNLVLAQVVDDIVADDAREGGWLERRRGGALVNAHFDSSLEVGVADFGLGSGPHGRRRVEPKEGGWAGGEAGKSEEHVAGTAPHIENGEGRLGGTRGLNAGEKVGEADCVHALCHLVLHRRGVGRCCLLVHVYNGREGRNVVHR